MESEINHLNINVSDPSASFPFYKELLEYLGYKTIRYIENTTAAFENNGFSLWFDAVKEKYKDKTFHRQATGINHLAFRVNSKEEVDKFYQEFLKPRKIETLYQTPKAFPEYTDKYYAVFFEDPDRIKLEVVYL
ncbi:MAG: VOC family protein [Patescibacteria group bacterium]